MRGLKIGTAVLAFALSLAPYAQALTTAFVDFENTPSLPKQPSEFLQAGNAQTITVPGVATFTGGVVLGSETNLPALSFGTAPNVYGTALNTFVGSSFVLPDEITITIASGFNVGEVSFPIFNGVTQTESYTVDAFNSSDVQIGQELVSNLASNLLGGHGVVDIKAAGIASVEIIPDSTTPWDFSIDSVAFNAPVGQIINPNGTPVTSNPTGPTGPPGPTSGAPAPSAGWSALAMLGALGLVAMIRSHRRQFAAI